MEELYHGGQVPHLEKLVPHESTHGKYVYATPNKDLAILFSVHKFDDLLLTIRFDKETNKYQIIERVPGIIEHVFKTSSSIYTVSKDGFMDIHTGFNELVSSSDVKVLNEERIENVFDYLYSCNSFTIYTYPNRPKDISLDDKDLFNKVIQYITDKNENVNEDTFERLMLLHPNLIPVIRDYTKGNHIRMKFVSEKRLVSLFRKYIAFQIIDEKHDFHLDSMMQMIVSSYPNLKETILEELKILNSSDKDRINYVVDAFYNLLDSDKKDIFIDRCKNMSCDGRNVSEVGSEIVDIFNNIKNGRYMKVLRRQKSSQESGYVLLLMILIFVGIFVLLVTFLN